MSSDSYFKNNRLLTKSDFENLRNNSKKLSTDDFVLFYSKPLKKESRLGISVSKKYGNAVKRNYIKRIVRETFRRSLFKAKGFDVLVCKKSMKKDISFLKMQKQLDNAFQKIEVQNG